MSILRAVIISEMLSTQRSTPEASWAQHGAPDTQAHGLEVVWRIHGHRKVGGARHLVRDSLSQQLPCLREFKIKEGAKEVGGPACVPLRQAPISPHTPNKTRMWHWRIC